MVDFVSDRLWLGEEGMTETDTSLTWMTRLWPYLLLNFVKATRAGTRNEVYEHILILLAVLDFVQ